MGWFKALWQVTVTDGLFCLTLVFFASAHLQHRPVRRLRLAPAGLGRPGRLLGTGVNLIYSSGIDGRLPVVLLFGCFVVFAAEHGGRSVARWIRQQVWPLRWTALLRRGCRDLVLRRVRPVGVHLPAILTKGGVLWPNPLPRSPHRRSKSTRGAPGRAPRRKSAAARKSATRFLLVFARAVRRIYFGLKTAFKFLLLVPVLVFMVAFSYNVDRSGLFQGALAPRRIVDLMLQGYDVTNFEQMDERQVVQLFAQDVPETPEAIGIGSSRVLQFNRENTGVESFFNMGVTGADVRDNMTSYYKMVTYGKAPKVLLWSIDPWVFYGSEAAFDARADADLYNEFLTKVLNVPTDYEEPDKVELWKALADPAYFQGNVDYYIKNRGQATVTDDDGNTIEFNPVEGDPYNQTTTIKRSDGSVLYDVAFRTQTEDQIRTLAAEACMSFNSVHMEGFDEMSPTQIQAFDSFIDYAQGAGHYRHSGAVALAPVPLWLPAHRAGDCTRGSSRWRTGCASTAPKITCRCTAATTPSASTA